MTKRNPTHRNTHRLHVGAAWTVLLLYGAANVSAQQDEPKSVDASEEYFLRETDIDRVDEIAYADGKIIANINGKVVQVIRPENRELGKYRVVDFSPCGRGEMVQRHMNGKYVLLVSYQRRQWQVPDEMARNHRILPPHFSHDGRWLQALTGRTGDRNKFEQETVFTLHACESATGKRVRRVELPQQIVRIDAYTISTDGKRAFAHVRLEDQPDEKIVSIDLETRKILFAVTPADAKIRLNVVNLVDHASSGQLLVVVLDGVFVLDRESGKLRRAVEIKGLRSYSRMDHFALSPMGKWFAAFDNKESVRIFDTNSWQNVFNLQPSSYKGKFHFGEIAARLRWSQDELSLIALVQIRYRGSSAAVLKWRLPSREENPMLEAPKVEKETGASPADTASVEVPTQSPPNPNVNNDTAAANESGTGSVARLARHQSGGSSAPTQQKKTVNPSRTNSQSPAATEATSEQEVPGPVEIGPASTRPLLVYQTAAAVADQLQETEIGPLNQLLREYLSQMIREELKSFPTVRVATSTQAELKNVFRRIELDTDKSGFDAIRFRTPGGASNWNLRWQFVVHRRKQFSWFIIPAAEVQMKGFERFDSERDFATPSTKLPPKNYRVTQELVGGQLKPDAEYLIWFRNRDDDAMPIHYEIVLTPATN